MRANPCNICLVKPCCTDACPDKHEYTEELLHFLCNLGTYIYDMYGERRSGVSSKAKKAFQEATDLAEQNSNEHKAIMDRYVKLVVH